MFDCILRWNNIAAARADAVALAHTYLDDQSVAQWLNDHVIPNVKVWRASQDTVDGDGNVVHSYLTGYYALVSVRRRIQVLEDSAALQLALDREKMNARQTPFLFKTNLSAALLADIRFEPYFFGMDIPWGGIG